jgi:hypothetical protein
MTGKKTSVYLRPELEDRWKASGVPLADLIERGLNAGEPETQDEQLRRIVREEVGVLPSAEDIDRIVGKRIAEATGHG